MGIRLSAAAGHVIGEAIDKCLGKYRCEKCGIEFEPNL